MLGAAGEAGLSMEAEAALASLEEAEVGIGMGKTEVALSSIVEARSILIECVNVVCNQWLIQQSNDFAI